jgi:hypothetical protein
MKSLQTLKPRLKGPPGAQLQLNASTTHLQWKIEGESVWQNLISLDDLSPLTMSKTGGAFTGNIQVKNILETIATPQGTIAGVVPLDLSAGGVFQMTLAGDVAGFDLINIPTAFSGTVALTFTCIISQSLSAIRGVDFKFYINTQQKPIRWPGGFTPFISYGYGATDIFSFMTVDGGENWFGFVGGQGF